MEKPKLPYDEGRVGMRNLKDVCKAFQFKQWSIFRSKKTLWGDFLKAKYCQSSNPVSKKMATKDSLTWKKLLINRPQVEQHIQWKLQAGNCSFWWDNWLRSGPLANFTSSSNRLNNAKVADFWEEGRWSWRRLLEQAPANQLSNILTTKISPSSIYQIRQFGSPTNMVASIVHQLGKRLEKKGSGTDSIAHIFSSGKFAATVWSSFAATAGMLPDCSSLQTLLQQWWVVKPRNAAHKTLLQATPIFICWNLWKNRCAAKYGGKTTNINRVKYAIYKDNYKMLTNAFPQVKCPAKWAELIQMCERCVHDIKVNTVTWIRPKDQWIKVNTDGSAINNPGRLGAGGILRDKSGRLVMTFTKPLGEGTNNRAEIEAAIFGLTWALELGYRNIILELDSQLVVHWILKKASPQWSITTQLGRLQNLISQVQNFKCLHVFREANWVADALSKHSHKTTSPQVYFNIQQMPKEARAYYHLDLLQMPSFRRKKTKRIKEPP
ncbi:uncharacterized protein LOC107022255 [Solanum pennellii]|uniref:Uncharacterized protein LOC107022255 n=1 Tax=Solanum pennellii TaxID=28526 RepID=A0ABM1GZZ8_SOLPN|nr:uncharacterized protein LOC107022255 [Solanum pennellii]